MRKTLLALVTILLCGSALAETITLKYQGLHVTANLERSGEEWQQRPVVLMTHGTLAHNRMEIMETLQAAFLDRGYSSLAINLSLGLSNREGMYECAVPHTHRHTDAMDEIGLWLNWLKSQKADQVVLLGHSRGGNQTARFAAAQDSDVLLGTILVAPQTWSEEYATKEYEKRYGKPLSSQLTRAEEFVRQGKGKTPLQPVDFIYCEGSSATAEAFVSYYRSDLMMDTPTVIETITKPVLVIAGSADQVVANLQGKMEKLTGRENIRLEVIEGADHFFRDLYADELADLSQEFIEGL